MANSKANRVIRRLRTAMLLRDGAGMTDGQLLDCFLSQRDDAAFAALVRRHGPMVWGVCRRVLHHHHDAEDAFQATFLVLARKAASIASRELLANWLYGVAHRTALKARATAAKRRARERQVTEMPERAVAEQELWPDLRPLLDQELSRLPDKYRVPIVLCDLEGKTRKEAARQLGWPEGTVAGRLAAARKMLARRLARRGVALSGGTLAAVLAHNVASACVPPALVSSTIQAATTLAAGQAAAAGLVSVKVAALTEGVVKTMLLSTLKTATAVLLAVGILGAGGVVYRTQTTRRADAQGGRYALATVGEGNKPLARHEGLDLDQAQKGFEIDPRFLANPDLKIDPRMFQQPEIDPRMFQPLNAVKDIPLAVRDFPLLALAPAEKVLKWLEDKGKTDEPKVSEMIVKSLQPKAIKGDENSVVKKALNWLKEKAQQGDEKDPATEKARNFVERVKGQRGGQNTITIHALLEKVDTTGSTINVVDVGEGVAARLLLMGRQQQKTPLTELAKSVVKRRTKLVNLPLANDDALRTAVLLLGGKAEKAVVTLRLTTKPQRGLEVVGVQQEL